MCFRALVAKQEQLPLMPPACLDVQPLRDCLPASPTIHLLSFTFCVQFWQSLSLVKFNDNANAQTKRSTLLSHVGFR